MLTSHRQRLEIHFDRKVLKGVLIRVSPSASEAVVAVFCDLSDREALCRGAMRAAVADAIESARVLAEAVRAALGGMVRIDYSHVDLRTRGA